MTPAITYHENFPLAVVSAGPGLGRWQRWVLRKAYIFESGRSAHLGIPTQALLDDLEADVRSAAEKADYEAFNRAYETLVSLHELLLGASLALADDGTVGSAAMLPDIRSFGERALYLNWTDPYRSVFAAAIGAMTRDTRLVRKTCHLVQHLRGKDLESCPFEIRDNVLQLPPLLMYHLSSWWVPRVEEQGAVNHGPHRMTMLQQPIQRRYDEVLTAFIGGWESARQVVADIPDAAKSFEWKSAAVIGKLNARHIEETARMLIAAVARGDTTAARFLADSLGKWWGSFSFEHDPVVLYGKTEFVMLDHLNLDWNTVVSFLGLTNDDLRFSSGPAELQRGVLVAAIRNFWTDIRLLAVEILLHTMQDDPSPTFDESLAMEIAVGLLTGRSWHGGGEVVSPLSELTASDYLTAKVRQYAYRSRLDTFIERVRDMEQPEMVTSRVYMFSGADDLRSLLVPQRVLLALLSSAEWQASASLRRQVDLWLERDYASIEHLRDLLRDWLAQFDRAEEDMKVLGALLERTRKTHAGRDGMTRGRAAVQDLQQFVDREREERIAAEPIDQERLNQISRYASSRAFSTETGKFPLQLFATVRRVNDGAGLSDSVFTFKQMRKGELTRVEMDQRAGNEQNFWAETLTNRVSVVVLGDVLRALPTREVVTPDAATYWEALTAESARILAVKRHPILILENATRPDWVWDWQHSGLGGLKHPKPKDLLVRRARERRSGYVCQFNEIEVYAAPIGAGNSFLLARESFRAVSFLEFEPNMFVAPNVVNRVDDRLLVDLQLRFSRRVDVDESELIRLVYGVKPADQA